MYDLYLGTEVGLLKGVNLENKEITNLNQPPTKDDLKHNKGIAGFYINSMMYSKPRKAEITMALSSNHLVKYDTHNDNIVNKLPYDFGPGNIRSIAYYNGRTVSASSSGAVKVWKKRQVVEEINAGQNLFVMRHNKFQQNYIATGGEENDLKVWDLNKLKKTAIFKAKNVADDYLDLRVPVSIREIQFYDEKKVITGTKYNQVRLYDLAAGKGKPVIDINFDQYPVTSIALAHNDYQVVVGNSHGRVALLDLRARQSIVYAFKKIAGSVRDIKVHPTKPLVIVGCLDKYLRIFDLKEHCFIDRLYTTSSITTMLLNENANS